MQSPTIYIRVATLFCAVFIITITAVPQTGSDADEKSLYERLGELPAIALVVSDFVDVFIQDPLIMANPAVKARKTADTAPYIKYQVTALTCQLTGGPCQYTGLDMKGAHDGLNVSEREWDRMVELFVQTLNKHKVPEAEMQELLGLLGPAKGDIVVAGN
jgi:hemoglobin